MEKLEDAVNQEREERISNLKGELDPMRERLLTLNTGIIDEMNDRVQKEHTIMKSMEMGNDQIADWLGQERKEREKQKKDLFDHFHKNLKSLDLRKGDFSKMILGDFESKEERIRKEVTSRFEEQNEIIEDLSEVICVFQKTLRVVSDKENKD